MSVRESRVAELVKKLAADFFTREADNTSIITVTRADVSSDIKNATIYFTVYPEASSKSALDFAKRKRTDFKKYAIGKIRMKRIPYFDFAIDKNI